MLKAIVVGLGAVALVATATAQVSGKGGPIRVKADRSEVLDRERKVILIDNVDITQGDARLRADLVTLSYGSPDMARSGGLAGNFGDIETMVAKGRVYYVTPDLKATGDTGIYKADTDTITLSGDVVLLRGEDVAQGATLTMELSAGRTMLEGGVNMVITPAEADAMMSAREDTPTPDPQADQ